MKWLKLLLDFIFGKSKKVQPTVPQPEAKPEPVVVTPPVQPEPVVVTPEPVPAPVDTVPETPSKKKIPSRKDMTDLLWKFTNGDVPTRIGPYKTVKETEGKNRSKQIDAINTTQGAYLGAPYCQAGIQEILDEQCRYYDISRKLVKIPEGAGTQKVWADTPAKYKKAKPVLCSWISWNHGGGKGHTGILIDMIDAIKFKTLEFNTSAAGQAVERDGEGFYYGLTRNINGYGSTTINGYIDVYEAIVDAMKESGKYEDAV